MTAGSLGPYCTRPPFTLCPVAEAPHRPHSADIKRDAPATPSSYQHDALGNRIKEAWTDARGAIDYSYLPGNYLVERGSTSYSWGTYGQLILKDDQPNALGGETNYDYNARRLMAQVRVDGSPVAQFFYDPYGRRVKIVEGDTTTTTITLYSGNDIVYEVKTKPGQPTLTTKYLAINGKYLAKVVQEGTNPPETYFYHTDLVGSVRAITDGHGQVVARFEYELFGVTVQASGTLADEVHKFTGKPEDAAIGLYYFNVRYCDAGTGRFTSKDPKEDTVNSYAYPRWNPLVTSDPTGEWGKDDHSGLTAALAQKAGFAERAASILGTAAACPDELASGISPVPVIGDPSWHFNTSRPGLPDSRLQHFLESKDQALDLAAQGKWDEALFAFGKGLHALQDYYAHGNQTPGTHFAGDIGETLWKYVTERKLVVYFWADDPLVDVPFGPPADSVTIGGWRPMSRREKSEFISLQELLAFQRRLRDLGCPSTYFE
ncbi:MAG TPA: hypothetical protein GXX55_10625 [Firmicutes bacterium]|nr:hypothetical protein [Bacillota bacterium]